MCYRYRWIKDSGIVDEYQEEIMQLSISVCQFYYAKQDNQWIKITRNFVAGKGKWEGAKVGIFASTQARQPTNGKYEFEYLIK